MKGNRDCPHCHGSGWYGDSTTDGDEPCNSHDVKNDPDEARLLTAELSDAMYRKFGAIGREVAKAAMQWLTFKPPAILLAANASDAEVLRDGAASTHDAFWDAYARTKLYDASTHVVLPLAEVEVLLEHLKERSFQLGCNAAANTLERMLEREAGKGEG